MIARSAIALAGAFMALAMPAQAQTCPAGYRLVSATQCMLIHKPVYRPRRVAKPKRYWRVERRPMVSRSMAQSGRARAGEQRVPPMPPPTPMWWFLEPNPFLQPYGRIVLPIVGKRDPWLDEWARRNAPVIQSGS